MIMLQHLYVNNIANVHTGRCIFMSILPPICNQQFHPLGHPMCDMATYNWPCVNTGLGGKIPSIFNVCPCALLMVMPNARRTRNWRTGNPPACEDLWVGPCARAKREHWMRKPHVHAYVRACVRDTVLFFLASRPNPRHCADSPLTQPSGATNQRAVAAGR